MITYGVHGLSNIVKAVPARSPPPPPNGRQYFFVSRDGDIHIFVNFGKGTGVQFTFFRWVLAQGY